MRWGEVKYAKAGEHHIAFRELVGDALSDIEIVMVNGANFPMDSLLDDPVAARLVEGLAGLGRLVTFDRRGIALSDPVSDWETPIREQWADDLAVVIMASGCDKPTVFSWESHAVARDCSVRYPGLIARLVLLNPRPSYTDDDAELREQLSAGLARLRAGRTRGGLDYANPGRGNDPAFVAWNDSAGRAGASPRLAEQMMDKRFSDPPFDHSRMRVPALVITRTPGNSPEADAFVRRTVRLVPGAEHVELGRGDYFAVGDGVDDVLTAISQYLSGEVRLPAPERQLAVIMFTDLVGSTRRASSSGDSEWKQLLDRHDAVSRFQVSRRGGEVIKTTGDGVLALLPSATAAVEVARVIREELEHDELEVRIGIHIGEVDRRGDDVSGLAVNIAARIMSTAEAGQILASAFVAGTTDAASFTSLGPQALKDIDGTWELHAAK